MGSNIEKVVNEENKYSRRKFLTLATLGGSSILLSPYSAFGEEGMRFIGRVSPTLDRLNSLLVLLYSKSDRSSADTVNEHGERVFELTKIKGQSRIIVYDKGGTYQADVGMKIEQVIVSPDGRRRADVLFSYARMEKELLVSNIDSSNVRSIDTASVVNADDISWSPDSKKIAYVKRGEGIYVADPEKETKIQLTDGASGAVRWCPTRNQILTWHKGDLVLIDLEKRRVENLFFIGYGGSDYNSYFRWSPEGDRIVYCKCAESSCAGTDLEGKLGEYNISTRTHRELFPVSNFCHTWFNFSPDGKRIAFVSPGKEPPTLQFSINIIDLERMTVEKVYDPAWYPEMYENCGISRMQWTPDGRNILFTSCDRSEGAPKNIVNVMFSGMSDLFEINLNSKEIARLTDNYKEMKEWEHFSYSIS